MIYQHIVVGYLEYGGSKGFDRGFFSAIGIFTLLVIPFVTIGPSLFGRRTGMGVAWGADPVMMVTDIFVEMAGFHILFALIFLLLALVGMRRYLDPSFAVLVPLAIVVPLIISAALAPHMDLSVRYLIFLLPVFFTLVGSGFVDLFDRVNMSTHQMLLVAGLFIAIIAAPTLMTYYTEYTKIDYRGAATYLTAVTNDGDTVVLVPQSRESAFLYYYNATTDGTTFISLNPDIPDLDTLVQKSRTVWLVKTEVTECLDPNAPINRWLADHAMTAQQTYTWIEMYRVEGGS
jgi:hypothetical protein